MNFISLKKLKRIIFKRSTLIAIPSLNDLLELNEDFSADEVFFSIVDLARQEFEKYFPLALQQKVYITPNPRGEFDFIDNFKAYIVGKISEDDINLIPNAVLGLTTNYYTNFSTMIRLYRYINPPKLTDFGYAAGVYFVRSLCSYPMFEEYTKESNCKTASDRAGIYFMIEQGPRWKIFQDEVYLQLCRYLLNLKKNMAMPNLPIELFQGLEEDYSKVESAQQTTYQQNLGNGEWFV